MAKQTLNNSESGLIIRGKINDNFTELYTRFVTPEDYGAVGDGVTNDQAAIQNSINSGYPVFFGRKNYRVTSTITVTDNTKLIGSGASSIISTTSNIRILTVAGSDNTIDNLTFVGNVTGADQTGIYVEGNVGLTLARNNNIISNCRLNNLTFGLYVRYTNITSSIHWGSVKVINTIAKFNTTGFYLFTRAEYSSFSNCSSIDNTYGLDIQCGNVNWVGGQITDNTNTGVYIGTGANDGHGVISGALINHNVSNVSCVSVAGNFLFTGCMIYAGTVTLTTSNGVTFDGCEFDTTTITSTNATNTEIQNCKFDTTPTITVTGVWPKLFNNKWMSATTYDDIGNATLVGGTVTVSSPLVKTNSIIQLSHQNTSGTIGVLYVSARVVGTSFTITSLSGTDTSIVGWRIFDKD